MGSVGIEPSDEQKAFYLGATTGHQAAAGLRGSTAPYEDTIKMFWLIVGVKLDGQGVTSRLLHSFVQGAGTCAPLPPGAYVSVEISTPGGSEGVAGRVAAQLRRVADEVEAGSECGVEHEIGGVRYRVRGI